ncbi:hypothetical protein [Micromonospora sp. NPDC050276]|uniref:hypothetical protein n=1 Tax=Micromonospora sp. NPDC050276 TaxID=3364278 RepID=UPI0037A8F44B
MGWSRLITPITVTVMNGWQWAEVASATVTPVVLGVMLWRERDLLAGKPRSQETATPAQPPRPLFRFARDTGSNVLANLIAAAVVYLLGVVGGLLPRSPYLVILSIMFVFGGLGVILFPLGMLLPGRPGALTASGSIMLIGLVGIVAPFIDGGRLNSLEGVAYPIIGWLAITSAIVGYHFRVRYL